MGLRGGRTRTRKISFGDYEYTKHIKLKFPETGSDWESVCWNLYMLVLFSLSPGHLFFALFARGIGRYRIRLNLKSNVCALMKLHGAV